jgi:hypothetical protein
MYNNVGLLEALQDILNRMNIQSSGKPLFKHIDVWNNQLAYVKDDNSGYSFATPAIFVEMKQIKSVQLGMGIVMSDYEVVLHIIDTQLNNSPNMDRNLKVFILRNLIKQRFELYQPAQMGKLMFQKDEQDFKHNNLYHFITTFKGALLDNWGNTFPQSSGTVSVVLSLGYTASVASYGLGYDFIQGATFSQAPPFQIYPSF